MPGDLSRFRLSVLGVVVISLFAALLSRMWYLQVMGSPQYEQVAAITRTRTVQVPPMRGRILDRNGRVLADNKRVLVVTVDRQQIKRTVLRKSLFEHIAVPLSTTPDALEKRYTDPRFDAALPLPLAENVSEDVAVFLKERAEDYPGVDVAESWSRVYTYAPYASHVIGFMGSISPDEWKNIYHAAGYKQSDRVGKQGIEKTYEAQLRGTPGYQRLEVDAHQRVLRVLDEVPAVPGRDVQLTIDIQVQQYAELALQAGIEQVRTRAPAPQTLPDGTIATFPNFTAPSGAMVVEDPQSGEVLAIASNPTFDNRWFDESIPQDKFNVLFNTPDKPLFDRAVQGTYNPASTIKAFTAMAALDSGVITDPREIYRDRGTYTVSICDGDYCPPLKNAGGVTMGDLSLSEAISRSADTYFYRIGDLIWRLKGNVLQDHFAQWGFGAPTGIDMPNEASGFIPTPQNKKARHLKNPTAFPDGKFFVADNMYNAVGQGDFVVTPIQLANAYATFANGGTLYKPHIVKAVLDPNPAEAHPSVVDVSAATVNTKVDPTAVRTVNLPANYRAPVLEGLTYVAEARPNTPSYMQGTATQLFTQTLPTFPMGLFPLAGKTGTAQDFSKLPQNDDSLFVGFGPVNQDNTPVKYVVAAVIDKAGFGAAGAAPIVKCMFTRLAGLKPFPELAPSGPLDRTAIFAAQLPRLEDRACLNVPGAAGD